MPELPEVETIVRGLRQPLMGRSVIDTFTDWPRQIDRPAWNEFRSRMRGRAFRSIFRRGKYLIFELDQGENLIIHLKMTGQLSVVPREMAADGHVHTVFNLDNNFDLRFRDVRKFGRLYLVRDPAEVLDGLGPEPLSDSFTSKWLYEETRRRKRVLKPLLLDQHFIAGIGNIYADEALHRAQINPFRKANTLSRKEAQTLTAAIRHTLILAINQEGSSIDAGYRKPDGSSGSMQAHFTVYGRGGELCPRCGAIVERKILGGRSTHFCPQCQY
jgi:formamidopyrimidine-DNA glycosylase